MSGKSRLETVMWLWRFSAIGRVVLAVLLVAVGWLGATGSPALQAVTTLSLCLTVVLACSGEPRRLHAALWTTIAVLVHLGGAYVRFTNAAEPPPLIDGLATAIIVPAGLVLLGWQVRSMTVHLTHALTTSGVAQAKLQRSNRELARAAKQTQAALGKLGTIVDNLAEGIVAVSLEQRIELANPAVARLLESDQLTLDRPMEDVLPDELQHLLRVCLDSQEVDTAEFELGDRSMLAVGSPIRVQGQVVGAVTLLRDVTLQREIDRMKNDFIAVVSHEMRTPLTSVLGFTKLITGQLDKNVFPLLPEDNRKAVKARKTVRGNLAIVMEEAQRLTALINDVLDISKMESGQMIWDFRPADPQQLVERAASASRGLFNAESPVQLVVDLPAELPLVVADADRIHQVLLNLISNAAKFTDAGQVLATAKVQGFSVVFEISDTGVGIRSGDIDSVFDKFRQVGDTLTDRPRGTGLGLPICREIVSRHGGRIWAESQLGQGSRFGFNIPIAGTTSGSLPLASLTERAP